MAGGCNGGCGMGAAAEAAHISSPWLAANHSLLTASCLLPAPGAWQKSEIPEVITALHQCPGVELPQERTEFFQYVYRS